VKVSGLTPREAERIIADRLGERYLNNPQVSVFVAESAGHKVTIIGHVKNPGVFLLVGGQTTLMQTIAMVGGLDELAKKRKGLDNFRVDFLRAESALYHRDFLLGD